MCKPMDVWRVVPVTVGWLCWLSEVWKDVGKKRLPRESEYLLNTPDISSTLF